MEIVKIEFKASAYKDLKKLPPQVLFKLKTWISSVELVGLREVRKGHGFHDEPLKGKRSGQRSVRLNRAYRVIYIEDETGVVKVVTILEVTKHEY